jgi:hypothetical protein
MGLRPDGAGVEVVERAAFPVNRGALCGKGRTAPAVLSSRVRLTEPLVRRATGRLEPATWEEALDRTAEGLAASREAHGPDAVGVFGGGGLTNEKAYASQIDYNGRFCMSSAAAAHQRAFGLDRGLPFPLADIPRTGCVILVGSNLAETMPPALRYLTELKENGGRLIVVDPRRTRTAEQADLHLAPRPGTDLALALAAPGGRGGPGGRGVHRGPYERMGRGTGGGDGALARAGRAHHGSAAAHAPYGRRAVLRRTELDGAHRARPRAAVQGHGHGQRLDQSVPGDRPGGPPDVRLRLSHRPGQWPGRA